MKLEKGKTYLIKSKRSWHSQIHEIKVIRISKLHIYCKWNNKNELWGNTKKFYSEYKIVEVL